jgi:hypothetical protein
MDVTPNAPPVQQLDPWAALFDMVEAQLLAIVDS